MIITIFAEIPIIFLGDVTLSGKIAVVHDRLLQVKRQAVARYNDKCGCPTAVYTGGNLNGGETPIDGTSING